jgi:hypothetical protein
MATTAAYIPVVGNFDPADGFLFENSVGDPVAIFGPGVGAPRPGVNKLGIVFFIGGGPVGDDASFVLNIPAPVPFTQEDVDTRFNYFLPTGSLVPSVPGAFPQDLYFQSTFNVATQTFNCTINFGAPAPILYVASLCFDFGHTITN